MAPPPEYDKEPKAPDKNLTTACSDDSKVLYTIVKDQQPNPEHKSTSATPSAEAENNKDVETLDDGQLRALLDEAITYKCPKDREGKSSLFKELLHEVEQDEQACEAARGLSAGRGARRGARGRRELQSNSLQDLVAAMAAEPAPRRHPARAHPPAVSARAHHGGSLPSGVDTSFLLSEEPPASPSYLATVRCVNPPPLAERRVSASDAHAPADVDLLARRSKPTFPMTYTARATLEIGSGSVCSGRAVTTTTASNQVRTTPAPAPRAPRRAHPARHHTAPPNTGLTGQMKLLNAMCPKKCNEKRNVDGGGIHEDASCSSPKEGPKTGVPRGQHSRSDSKSAQRNKLSNPRTAYKHDHMDQQWVDSVHNWYESLDNMKPLINYFTVNQSTPNVKEKSVSLPLPNTRDRADAKNYSGVSLNKNCKSRANTNNSSTNAIEGSILYNLTNTNTNSNETAFDAKAEKVYSIPAQLYTTSNIVNDYSNLDSDIILRKKYRERVGYDLVPPHSLPASPKFFKNATIGLPNTTLSESNQLFEKPTYNASKTNNNNHIKFYQSCENINDPRAEALDAHDSCTHSNICEKGTKQLDRNELAFQNIALESELNSNQFYNARNSKSSASNPVAECNSDLSIEYENTGVSENMELNEKRNDYDSKVSSSASFKDNDVNKMSTLETSFAHSNKQYDDCKDVNENIELHSIELKETKMPTPSYSKDQDKIILDPKCETGETSENEIELADIPLCKQNVGHSDDFLQHLAVQQKFLQNLQNSNNNNTDDYLLSADENKQGNKLINVDQISIEKNIETVIINTNESTSKELVIKENVVEHKENVKDKFIFAELPNNAYVFLTLPQSFFNNVSTKEIENCNNVVPYTSGESNTSAKRSKTKNKCKRDPPEKNVKSNNVVNKSALKLLLYSNSSEKCLATPGLSLNSNKEVDSAIPFTCITTPEVVASCNTTASTPQAAVAVDPKPLQLGSCYRAVASLTGSWAPPAAPAVPGAPAAAAPPDPAAELQPRSVISSSFNGLPLSRPNYGSTATTANDEYKKSLDENGNAVQGFTSPLSGSSQQKKPRRKKSTKNETVIKSHQIDGYQGNKDLNEVLRFIESNADTARAQKPGRAKHKDDSDDKGKKRSSSRKDKESKAKRASSLEELSRTKLEDLTAAPPRAPPAKPERRSWGDDARDAFYLREPDAAELTDFQTVTKKRKPRRRADDAAADPPRRPRAPSPRRAPSDRSNDSNDDLDSVHSLPATRAPPAAPHASYADIARTRHNIPDLIESCNFYAEGETREPRAAPPPDADYPALAARRRKPGGAGARAATCKDRAEPPAPDVVADRRPPVVLLDSAARPRDMDGVTFGFDVNEQLLGAPPRRGVAGGGARCDLLRDTEDGATGAVGQPGAVAVPLAGGGGALRYVPPPPAPLAPHLHHLHRIVDYVGAAWEDVVRCSGGKLRYFSE